MKDVETLRAETISKLKEVEAMIPTGPSDQVIPMDIQEKMKSKLQDYLDSLE